MKLTIKKTLLLSLAVFGVLAIAALAVLFLRVNRTLTIGGQFEYRSSSAVTALEGGYVNGVDVDNNSRIAEGQVLLVLTNADLEAEISNTERLISGGVIELGELSKAHGAAVYNAEQDVKTLEVSLRTQSYQLEYQEELHRINRDLHNSGSITKERYSASELALREVQGAVDSLAIRLNKARRMLDELASGPGIAWSLKAQAVESHRNHLSHLNSRFMKLTVRAPADGMLLSNRWDTLPGTFLAKGENLGAVVSFDDINFRGVANDTDIIRIKKGQRAYFDVDLFRRKVFVNGTVAEIGYDVISAPDGINGFPVTIELENKKFIDRDQDFYIQAGVKGQAVIIVEEKLSLMSLVWEKVLKFYRLWSLHRVKNVLYIFKFVKPYAKYIVILLLILAFSSFLNVIHPYLTYKVILDELLPRNDYSRIAIIASVVILIALVIVIAHFLQGYIMSYLGARVTFDIRRALLRHIQSLSLRFYSDRNSGAILERLNQDVMGIRQLLTDQAVTLVSNGVQIVFLTLAIFKVNATLALLVVGLVTIQTIFVIFAVRSLHGKIKGLRKSETDLVGELQERISLIQLIQAFVKQKFEERMHHRKSMNIIRQALDIASVRSRMMSFFFLTTDLIPLFVIWLGVFLIVQGRFQIGALLTMVSYANNFLRPVVMIVMGINTLQESVVGIQRVKEFFDEKPEIVEIDNPIRKSRVEGHIEFRNVDFAYDADKPVLFANSFAIEKGQTVAFVGESGSGKSTVTNLMFRFYDPDSGEVLLDGEPLKNYSVRFLREQVGVVFQETDLFAATIRENLAYGVKGHIGDEEIMKAVRMTLLEEVIEKLPDGLDTVVEERGGNFSGGEKQRIAICRVLLKNPAIVIFDEATSALDSASENLIQNTIDQVMKEPTSILIAHRLSTVIGADKIFVMKDGRIAEQGTHRSLLDDGGEYRMLWDEQLKKDRAAHAAAYTEANANVDTTPVPTGDNGGDSDE